LRSGAWEGELIHTRRDGARLVVASRWTVDREPGGRPGGLVEVASDVTAQARQRGRSEALLRATRRFASDSGASRPLVALLQEAAAIMGADGAAVLRWDQDRGGLEIIRHTLRFPVPPPLVTLGQGAVGRAAAQRSAVIVEDYQHVATDSSWAVESGAR